MLKSERRKQKQRHRNLTRAATYLSLYRGINSFITMCKLKNELYTTMWETDLEECARLATFFARQAGIQADNVSALLASEVLARISVQLRSIVGHLRSRYGQNPSSYRGIRYSAVKGCWVLYGSSA